MNESGRPVRSLTALAGGSAAIVVDILYLSAIAQQGVTPPGGRVAFVAGWVAAAAVLSVVGAFVRRPPARAAMLGFGAAMIVAIGLPAVFSIGIPLLLCGALVAIGAIRAAWLARMPAWSVVAGPLSMLLVAGLGIAIGFAVTDF